jgi:regulator of cell morphogenesis and NO signaling
MTDPAQPTTASRPSTEDVQGDETAWPLDRLIDHIVSTHHAYLRQALPTLARRLSTLSAAHAAQHPELARVADIFDRLRAELEQHMLKEERVLFPYVRDLADQADSHGFTGSPFGTVENPIRMMEREHADAGEALDTIRELTHDYVAPAHGGGSWQSDMDALLAFDRDLLRHVHLENDVLFPAAIRLERRLSGRHEH